MKTFYSPTSMNNKYEVKSYTEIKEAGKNFGGNNVVEYKGYWNSIIYSIKNNQKIK